MAAADRLPSTVTLPWEYSPALASVLRAAGRVADRAVGILPSTGERCQARRGRQAAGRVAIGAEKATPAA